MDTLSKWKIGIALMLMGIGVTLFILLGTAENNILNIVLGSLTFFGGMFNLLNELQD